MFSIITKKQIIKKQLNHNDLADIIMEYSNGDTNIAMIDGHIPHRFNLFKDDNSSTPSIILGDVVYYFIHDECIWIVYNHVAEKILKGNTILVGSWSKKAFDNRIPTVYFTEPINHRIYKDYEYLSENDIKEMMDSMKELSDKMNLQTNMDPQWHFNAIHYVLEYHNMNVPKYSRLYDHLTYIDYMDDNWINSSDNNIIVGFINILSTELTRHGFLNMDTEEHDFFRKFTLTDKGRVLMNALRLEGLDSDYSEEYRHDFWDRDGWNEEDHDEQI